MWKSSQLLGKSVFVEYWCEKARKHVGRWTGSHDMTAKLLNTPLNSNQSSIKEMIKLTYCWDVWMFVGCTGGDSHSLFLFCISGLSVTVVWVSGREDVFTVLWQGLVCQVWRVSVYNCCRCSINRSLIIWNLKPFHSQTHFDTPAAEPHVVFKLLHSSVICSVKLV